MYEHLFKKGTFFREAHTRLLTSGFLLVIYIPTRHFHLQFAHSLELIVKWLAAIGNARADPAKSMHYNSILRGLDIAWVEVTESRHKT